MKELGPNVRGNVAYLGLRFGHRNALVLCGRDTAAGKLFNVLRGSDRPELRFGVNAVLETELDKLARPPLQWRY